MIVNNLLRWHRGDPIPDTRSPLEDDQDKIGWDYILEGVTPLSWETHQSAHYLTSGQPYSGKRWVSALIRKLWEIAWDIWELRNNIAHKTNHLALLSETDQRIKDELESGPPTQTLNALFSIRQQEILQHATLAYKQAWLRHIDTVRTHQQTTYASSSSFRQMRRTMRLFLANNNENPL